MAVRKLDGVTAVDVSLERGSAVIDLRPGNRVTLPQLRAIIKNNGFTAKSATVTVVGTLLDRGGRPALSIAGTDQVWLLKAGRPDAAYADAVQRVKTQQAGPVEAMGTVEVPANPNQPEELAVEALKPVPK